MLVNLDVPIRPMDYLQRIGRIVRQGNLHLPMDKPVRILRLGVKQTLDVTGYQRLKIKESFIKQAMKGEVTERSLEEPETDSSDSTNFGQMMASLSGSAAALALSLEQNKLRKLRNARDYYNQHQIYVAHELKRLQNVLQTTPQIIAQIRKKKDFLRSLFPDNKWKWENSKPPSRKKSKTCSFRSRNASKPKRMPSANHPTVHNRT